MQQLNVTNIMKASHPESKILRIDLPLPSTPLKTEQWLTQFCQCIGAYATNCEWGADRFQATLNNENLSCLLFIEWMCDAIWIEPIGTGTTADEIYKHLFHRK